MEHSTDAEQRAWQAALGKAGRQPAPAAEQPRHSSPVRSAALVPTTTKPSRALGLFALALAAPLWLEGARTTRDGWIVVINWLFARFHIPLIIQPATAWAWYVALGALIGLGLLYSRIELQAPVRWPRNLRRDFFTWSLWSVNRSWQMWAVWLVLVISDVGTMYLGARFPDAGAAPIFVQIAAVTQLAAAYAIIVTFAPERLAIFGWRNVKG
jgi:hypothetical protein